VRIRKHCICSNIGHTYNGYNAAANFFSAYHRKHPTFPREPDFQVAVAVSILRVLNVWQELKFANMPPDSDSELDSNSETWSWECNCLFSTGVVFQIQTPLVCTARGLCGGTGFVSKVQLGLRKIGQENGFF